MGWKFIDIETDRADGQFCTVGMFSTQSATRCDGHAL